MDKVDQLAEWCRKTFWRRRDHVSESTGTQEAGLPVVLNTLGKLAISLFSPIVGNLTLTGILTVTSDFITGSSTFLTGVYGAARAQIEKASNGTLLLTRTSNDVGGPTLEFLKRRNGWGVVSVADRIGTIGFSAADGVDAAIAAQIAVEVDVIPGSNDMPGRFVFSVTADGTQTLQTILVLFSSLQARFYGEAAFIGATDETALGYDNVRIGLVGGSPCAIFEDAGFTQWQIDNNAGVWRLFQPGSVKLSHDGTTFAITGNVTVSGHFGAWNNITFGTGWTNLGGSYQTCQYRKVGDMVFLRGLAQRTSGAGTSIAVLPSLHRPPASVLCDVQSNGALGRIDIGTDGNLGMITGSATWINLGDIPPFSITA